MSYFYREVKRTEGISTTDVVARMLSMTRQHFYRGDKEYTVEKEHSSIMGQDKAARSPWTGCSQFLPTTKKIIQFSEGTEPKVRKIFFDLISNSFEHLLVKIVVISADRQGSVCCWSFRYISCWSFGLFRKSTQTR